MTVFNWSIVTCEYQVTTGGITVAHWDLSAVDEGCNARAYGSVGFTPNPQAEDFKPYEQVTEADVLSWVWASGVNKEEVESSLQQQIDAQKAPKIAVGTPW